MKKSILLLLFVTSISYGAVWNQPNSAQCFMQWQRETLKRLNNYSASKAWNAQKPYVFNDYGLVQSADHVQNIKPGNFDRHQNLFHWMWRYYAEDDYWWQPIIWRKAQVPPLHEYVATCLAQQKDGIRWQFPRFRNYQHFEEHFYEKPTKDQKTFNKPTFRGYAVDRCVLTDKHCGKAAADKFCQLKGYKRATAFTGSNNVGPTRHLGNNKICPDKDCDGFERIKCSNND